MGGKGGKDSYGKGYDKGYGQEKGWGHERDYGHDGGYGYDTGGKKGGKSKVTAPGKGMAHPPVRSEVGKSVDGQEYWGTVKSFNQSTGYGFISCDETFAQYGRDVYLPADKAA